MAVDALVLAAGSHPAPVDVMVFAVSAVIVLGGAIGVIGSRNPVHSALSLVVTLFGIAVLFVEQEAHFLAAVQVIVYAGAIVVLFLFVIMLLGVDQEENIDDEPLKGQRPAAAIIGAIGLVLLILVGASQWHGGATGAQSVAGPISGTTPNVELLARVIFTRDLLPFEVTSVLLVIAVVGAVVLARRPERDPSVLDQVTG